MRFALARRAVTENDADAQEGRPEVRASLPALVGLWQKRPTSLDFWKTSFPH